MPPYADTVCLMASRMIGIGRIDTHLLPLCLPSHSAPRYSSALAAAPRHGAPRTPGRQHRPLGSPPGGKRPQRCRCHLRHDSGGLPLARPDPTQGRPIGKRQRQRGPKPLEHPFTRIAEQGDQHPGEHQKVLRLGTAKVPLARVQHLIDLAGDACAISHESIPLLIYGPKCESWQEPGRPRNMR